MNSSPDSKNDNNDKSRLNEKIAIEFQVKVENENDLKKINSLLSEKKGVKLISMHVESKTIQLELDNFNEFTTIKPADRYDTIGDIQSIQKLIEKETGFLTVVKGIGTHSSAVTELRSSENGNVFGIVRLSQLSNEKCFVDGLLDGFNKYNEFNKKNCDKSKFTLSIHQYGDMNGPNYDSIGEPTIKICDITDEEKNCDSMSIRKIIPNCNVMSMIGKSIALTEHYETTITNCENKLTKRVLSAGVIARAATIATNKKQICTCSGKTIWEERIERQQKD